jgi:hypothetical protein
MPPVAVLARYPKGLPITDCPENNPCTLFAPPQVLRRTVLCSKTVVVTAAGYVDRWAGILPPSSVAGPRHFLSTVAAGQPGSGKLYVSEIHPEIPRYPVRSSRPVCDQKSLVKFYCVPGYSGMDARVPQVLSPHSRDCQSCSERLRSAVGLLW